MLTLRSASNQQVDLPVEMTQLFSDTESTATEISDACLASVFLGAESQ